MSGRASIQSLNCWSPIPGVVLREKVYAPGVILEPHSHEHATLILVLVGGFREECGGEVVVRRPGELRIMPPEAPHSNAYGSAGARCFLIELHHPWLAESPVRSRSVARVAHHQRGTRPAALAHRMYDDFRVGDDAAGLSIEGCLLETLAVNLRLDTGAGPARTPPWLSEVRDRLHDEFARPPRLKDLAMQADVHLAHLHRAFRTHFHCTPGDYVRARRIEWARHALLRSAEPISRIALQAGFSDQSHFTRRFRALVGLTPARFRRLRRAE